MKKMKSHIQIKLFAGLQPFMPPSGEKYPIHPGISILEFAGAIESTPRESQTHFH